MTKAIKWITYGALFLIPFLPLVVTNSLFFPFITGKNFGFRMLVEIAFAGWVLLMLVDAKYRPRFSWTAALLGALVVWMAVADAFAVNPAKAFWSNFERMDGWITLIHFFMLFLVAGAMFGADKLWRKWWYTFLSGAALVCAWCFFQLACVGQKCSQIFPIDQGGVRIDGRFGNAEYLAAYLLFTIAIALWLAFEAKEKWVRYSLFILAAVSVIFLFYSETRGAILGFIGAVALGAVLWLIEAGKRGRQAAGGVLVALLILVGIFFGIKNSPIVTHIPGLDRLASISASNSESTTRLTIWHIAIEGFQEKPITGWGQEGFNYVFNKYYEPSLFDQEPYFDRAHNVFLDWLVAGGAPALLLFLAVLVTAVVALYRNSNVTRTERIMLVSALAAYCFQGLFVFDNLFTYVPLAILLAMVHDASGRPIAQFAVEKWKLLSDDNFQVVAVPLMTVVLILTLWFVNVPNIRAGMDLIAALTPNSDPNVTLAAFKQAYADGSYAQQEITEQLVTYATSIADSQSISTADKNTVFTYALGQMDALTKKIPGDARIWLEDALGYRAAGDYKDALVAVGNAHMLSPHKQSILIEQGLEQWQSGDVKDAQVTFNAAYQLDPSIQDMAPYAAAGDILAGDTAAGKALLQQVYGTTTVDQQILMLAYYNQKDYPDLIALLQQQVIDQKNSANAEFELAAAYANAGNNAAARAEVQLAISQHPEDATQGAALLAQIPQGK